MAKSELLKGEYDAHFSMFKVSDILGGLRARYPACYQFVKDYEGGYVNDPNDPGGCTNMGITINTLKTWRGDPSLTCEDVKSLGEPEVGLIYASSYWAPVWGNQLPVGLNLQVFDFGVNAGPYRSISKLQALVGTDVDGIMGPNTLEATDNYCDDHGVSEVIDAYSQIRQDYYESLSNFSIYGNGWTARNEACCQLGKDLATQGTPVVFPTSRENLEQRVSKLERWVASFDTL